MNKSKLNKQKKGEETPQDSVQTTITKIINALKEASAKDWIMALVWMITMFSLMIGLRQIEMLSKRCEVTILEHSGLDFMSNPYLNYDTQKMAPPPINNQDSLYYINYYKKYNGKPPWHQINCSFDIKNFDWNRILNLKWVID